MRLSPVWDPPLFNLHSPLCDSLSLKTRPAHQLSSLYLYSSYALNLPVERPPSILFISLARCSSIFFQSIFSGNNGRWRRLQSILRRTWGSSGTTWSEEITLNGESDTEREQENREERDRARSCSNNNNKDSHSHSGVVGSSAYPYRSAQAFWETCRSICSSEQSRHVALHNNDEGALRWLGEKSTSIALGITRESRLTECEWRWRDVFAKMAGKMHAHDCNQNKTA